MEVKQMIINRNGKEIELTPAELRMAHDEYKLNCVAEDIGVKYEDYISDILDPDFAPELTDDDTYSIAQLVINGLEKNDSYWESYWETVRQSIKDFVENKSAAVISDIRKLGLVSSDAILYNAFNVDGEKFSVSTPIAGLIADWYGDAALCPENDSYVSDLKFYREDKHAKINGVVRFDSLMQALCETLLKENA
jgi:hypothetical protein